MNILGYIYKITVDVDFHLGSTCMVTVDVDPTCTSITGSKLIFVGLQTIVGSDKTSKM